MTGISAAGERPDALPAGTAMWLSPSAHAKRPVIKIQGSKNAFLCVMALGFSLRRGSITLEGVPATSDLATMNELTSAAGLTSCAQGDDFTVSGPPASGGLACGAARRLRHTISYACALAANIGWCAAPVTGGDAFTVRPIDIHLRVIEAAGGRWTISKDGRLVGLEFPRGPRRFDVSVSSGYGPDQSAPVGSLGATVSAIAVAAQATGWSVIRCVPREPEIEAVIDAGQALGIQHEWAGADTLLVHGRDGVDGNATVSVPADRIEAGTYAFIGSLMAREVTLTGIRISEFPAGFIDAAFHAGLAIEPSAAQGPTVVARLRSCPQPVNVRTEPHPGYPTDLQPPLCAFLLQAEGESTIEETMYASRVSHVQELAGFGLNVEIVGRCQRIRGRQDVRGGIATVRDIRCGASLLVAAAATREAVEIRDPLDHLARGYSELDSKLAAVGFSVQREKISPASTVTQKIKTEVSWLGRT